MSDLVDEESFLYLLNSGFNQTFDQCSLIDKIDAISVLFVLPVYLKLSYGFNACSWQIRHYQSP